MKKRIFDLGKSKSSRKSIAFTAVTFAAIVTSVFLDSLGINHHKVKADTLTDDTSQDSSQSTTAASTTATKSNLSIDEATGDKAGTAQPSSTTNASQTSDATTNTTSNPIEPSTNGSDETTNANGSSDTNTNSGTDTSTEANTDTSGSTGVDTGASAKGQTTQSVSAVAVDTQSTADTSNLEQDTSTDVAATGVSTEASTQTANKQANSDANTVDGATGEASEEVQSKTDAAQQDSTVTGVTSTPANDDSSSDGQNSSTTAETASEKTTSASTADSDYIQANMSADSLNVATDANAISVTLIDANTGTTVEQNGVAVDAVSISAGQRLPAISSGGIVYLPIPFSGDSQGDSALVKAQIAAKLTQGYSVYDEALRAPLTDAEIASIQSGNSQVKYIAVNSVLITADGTNDSAKLVQYDATNSANNLVPNAGFAPGSTVYPTVGVDITDAKSTAWDQNFDATATSAIEFAGFSGQTGSTDSVTSDWFSNTFERAANGGTYTLADGDTDVSDSQLLTLRTGVNTYSDASKILTLSAVDTTAGNASATVNDLLNETSYEYQVSNTLVDKNGNILRFRVENPSGVVDTSTNDNGYYTVDASTAVSTYEPTDAEVAYSKSSGNWQNATMRPSWLLDYTFSDGKYQIKVDEAQIAETLKTRTDGDNVFSFSYSAGTPNAMHTVTFRFEAPVDYELSKNGSTTTENITTKSGLYVGDAIPDVDTPEDVLSTAQQQSLASTGYVYQSTTVDPADTTQVQFAGNTVTYLYQTNNVSQTGYYDVNQPTQMYASASGTDAVTGDASQSWSTAAGTLLDGTSDTITGVTTDASGNYQLQLDGDKLTGLLSSDGVLPAQQFVYTNANGQQVTVDVTLQGDVTYAYYKEINDSTAKLTTFLGYEDVSSNSVSRLTLGTTIAGNQVSQIPANDIGYSGYSATTVTKLTGDFGSSTPETIVNPTKVGLDANGQYTTNSTVVKYNNLILPTLTVNKKLVGGSQATKTDKFTGKYGRTIAIDTASPFDTATMTYMVLSHTPPTLDLSETLTLTADLPVTLTYINTTSSQSGYLDVTNPAQLYTTAAGTTAVKGLRTTAGSVTLEDGSSDTIGGVTVDDAGNYQVTLDSDNVAKALSATTGALPQQQFVFKNSIGQEVTVKVTLQGSVSYNYYQEKNNTDDTTSAQTFLGYESTNSATGNYVQTRQTLGSTITTAGISAAPAVATGYSAYSKTSALAGDLDATTGTAATTQITAPTRVGLTGDQFTENTEINAYSDLQTSSINVTKKIDSATTNLSSETTYGKYGRSFAVDETAPAGYILLSASPAILPDQYTADDQNVLLTYTSANISDTGYYNISTPGKVSVNDDGTDNITGAANQNWNVADGTLLDTTSNTIDSVTTDADGNYQITLNQANLTAALNATDGALGAQMFSYVNAENQTVTVNVTLQQNIAFNYNQENSTGATSAQDFDGYTLATTHTILNKTLGSAVDSSLDTNVPTAATGYTDYGLIEITGDLNADTGESATESVVNPNRVGLTADDQYTATTDYDQYSNLKTAKIDVTQTAIDTDGTTAQTKTATIYGKYGRGVAQISTDSPFAGYIYSSKDSTDAADRPAQYLTTDQSVNLVYIKAEGAQSGYYDVSHPTGFYTDAAGTQTVTADNTNAGALTLLDGTSDTISSVTVSDSGTYQIAVNTANLQTALTQSEDALTAQQFVYENALGQKITVGVTLQGDVVYNYASEKNDSTADAQAFLGYNDPVTTTVAKQILGTKLTNVTTPAAPSVTTGYTDYGNIEVIGDLASADATQTIVNPVRVGLDGSGTYTATTEVDQYSNLKTSDIVVSQTAVDHLIPEVTTTATGKFGRDYTVNLASTFTDAGYILLTQPTTAPTTFTQEDQTADYTYIIGQLTNNGYLDVNTPNNLYTTVSGNETVAADNTAAGDLALENGTSDTISGVTVDDSGHYQITLNTANVKAALNATAGALATQQFVYQNSKGQTVTVGVTLQGDVTYAYYQEKNDATAAANDFLGYEAVTEPGVDYTVQRQTLGSAISDLNVPQTPAVNTGYQAYTTNSLDSTAAANPTRVGLDSGGDFAGTDTVNQYSNLASATITVIKEVSDGSAQPVESITTGKYGRAFTVSTANPFPGYILATQTGVTPKAYSDQAQTVTYQYIQGALSNSGYWDVSNPDGFYTSETGTDKVTAQDTTAGKLTLGNGTSDTISGVSVDAAGNYQITLNDAQVTAALNATDGALAAQQFVYTNDQDQTVTVSVTLQGDVNYGFYQEKNNATAGLTDFLGYDQVGTTSTVTRQTLGTSLATLAAPTTPSVAEGYDAYSENSLAVANAQNPTRVGLDTEAQYSEKTDVAQYSNLKTSTVTVVKQATDNVALTDPTATLTGKYGRKVTVSVPTTATSATGQTYVLSAQAPADVSNLTIAATPQTVTLTYSIGNIAQTGYLDVTDPNQLYSTETGTTKVTGIQMSAGNVTLADGTSQTIEAVTIDDAGNYQVTLNAAKVAEVLNSSDGTMAPQQFIFTNNMGQTVTVQVTLQGSVSYKHYQEQNEATADAEAFLGYTQVGATATTTRQTLGSEIAPATLTPSEGYDAYGTTELTANGATAVSNPTRVGLDASGHYTPDTIVTDYSNLKTNTIKVVKQTDDGQTANPTEATVKYGRTYNVDQTSPFAGYIYLSHTPSNVNLAAVSTDADSTVTLLYTKATAAKNGFLDVNDPTQLYTTADGDALVGGQANQSWNTADGTLLSGTSDTISSVRTDANGNYEVTLNMANVANALNTAAGELPQQYFVYQNALGQEVTVGVTLQGAVTYNFYQEQNQADADPTAFLGYDNVAQSKLNRQTLGSLIDTSAVTAPAVSTGYDAYGLAKITNGTTTQTISNPTRVGLTQDATGAYVANTDVNQYSNLKTSTITVSKQIYSDTSSEGTQTTTATGKYGRAYTVNTDNPFVGYQLISQTPETLPTEFTLLNQSADFVYSKAVLPPDNQTATLTIIYVNDQGQELGRQTKEMPVGSGYSVTPEPSYGGYTYIRTEGSASGTMGTEPVTVTFVYGQGQLVDDDETSTITINYYTPTGQLIGTETTTLPNGAHYAITPEPTYKGYIYSRPATGDLLEGTVDGNKVINLIYRGGIPAPDTNDAQVTIIYQDQNGNILHQQTTAMGHNAHYDITPPASYNGYPYVGLADGSSPLAGTVGDGQTIIMVFEVPATIQPSVPETPTRPKRHHHHHWHNVPETPAAETTPTNPAVPVPNDAEEPAQPEAIVTPQQPEQPVEPAVIDVVTPEKQALPVTPEAQAKAPAKVTTVKAPLNPVAQKQTDTTPSLPQRGDNTEEAKKLSALGMLSIISLLGAKIGFRKRKENE